MACGFHMPFCPVHGGALTCASVNAALQTFGAAAFPLNNRMRNSCKPICVGTTSLMMSVAGAR